jgi:hypothetical protein
MISRTLIITSILVAFSIFLAACVPKNHLQTESLPKAAEKTQQETPENQPSQTDDQLLKEMQADDSPNIDQEFTKVEQELK